MGEGKWTTIFPLFSALASTLPPIYIFIVQKNAQVQELFPSIHLIIFLHNMHILCIQKCHL